MNLERPIIHEMERQGNIVYFVEDKVFPNSWHFKVCRKKLIKCILFRKQEEKYWKKTIKDNVNFQLKFDLLFCINGTSFDKYLYDFLKKNNPHIKTCIYLWDTIRYYDFGRNLKYFDKAFTFDYQDSLDYSNLTFLPFYWVKPSSILSEIYDISIIGSDHDNRYEIVSKIYKQLIKENFNCYFKIVIQKCQRPHISIWSLISYFKKVTRRKKYIIDYNIPEIISTERISIGMTNKIISQSRCILDTDRECQSGTTPRVIWALALGKKIITTNKSIRNLPFYDKDRIQIIDRNNPYIDTNFLRIKNNTGNNSNYFEKLKIENWIENFIK